MGGPTSEPQVGEPGDTESMQRFFDSLEPPTEEELFKKVFEPLYGIPMDRYQLVQELVGRSGNDFAVEGLSEVAVADNGITLYGTDQGRRDARVILESARLTVREEVETDGEPFEYQQSEAVSDRPWYGGSGFGRYVPPSGPWSTYSCSGGFTFYRPAFVPGYQWWYTSTAGHCSYQGGSLNPGLWTFSPTTNHTMRGPDCCSWAGNNGDDLALFHLDTTLNWGPFHTAAPTRAIWAFCTNTWSFTGCGLPGNYGAPVGTQGVSTPTGGDPVCKTGQRRGTACGTYGGMIGSFPDMLHRVDNLDACGAFPGDSGSAVYQPLFNGTVGAVGVLTQTIGAAPVFRCGVETHLSFAYVSVPVVELTSQTYVWTW